MSATATESATTTAQPTLVYIYDALCSWCFGFEPVVQQVSADNADRVNLQVISGGMSLGPGRQHIKSILGDDPRPVYQRIIDTTGAPILSPYLDGLVGEKNYLVDSERPALALAAFRADPANEGRDLEFANAMQTAMYSDGLDPADDDYYRRAAETVGIDADALLAAMTTDEAREGAEGDFALTQVLGVRGFPAVFLRGTDDTYVQLSAGYQNAEGLTATLDAGLQLLAARQPEPAAADQSAAGETCEGGVCDLPGTSN